MLDNNLTIKAKSHSTYTLWRRKNMTAFSTPTSNNIRNVLYLTWIRWNNVGVLLIHSLTYPTRIQRILCLLQNIFFVFCLQNFHFQNIFTIFNFHSYFATLDSCAILVDGREKLEKLRWIMVNLSFFTFGEFKEYFYCFFFIFISLVNCCLHSYPKAHREIKGCLM